MKASEVMEYQKRLLFILDEESLEYDEKRRILLKLSSSVKACEKQLTEIIPNEFFNHFLNKRKSFFVNKTVPNFVLPDTFIFFTIKNKLDKHLPLTKEEANHFLNWMCVMTKLVIYKHYAEQELFSIPSNLEKFTFEGYCGLASHLLVNNFKRLGLYSIQADIDKFLFTYSHEMAIVKIPIEDCGKTVETTYLLDCTYRQFFSLYDCHKDYEGCPNVGYYMMFNDENIQFADNLLKNGYCELNEKNAKLYFDGFYLAHNGRYHFDYEKNILTEPIDYEGKDYIDLMLTHPCKSEYTKDYFEEYDIVEDYFTNLRFLLSMYDEYYNENKNKNLKK